MNLRLSLEKWVAEAIDKYKMGQETDYAVSLAWTPTGEGMRLAWNIPLVQSSPLIGQTLTHVCLLPDPRPMEATIDAAVMEGLKVLREQRASALRITNGRPS